MNVSKYKIMLAACLVFLHIANVKAQQEEPVELSLKTCKMLILENNEDAIIASSKVKLSEEKINEVKTKFFPSLSASSTSSAFTDNPVLTTFARYSVLSNVTLEQPIYFGGKIQSLNKLAKIQREIALEEKKLSDEQLLFYVEQLYWQVVAIEQQLIVSDNYLQTLTALEEKILNFYKAGIVNKTDLLETQVEKNRAAYNNEVAKNAVDVAKLQLALAIGLEKTVFKVYDDFPEKLMAHNYNKDLSTAYNLRPEVHILEQSILVKKEQNTLIKSEYRPQIGLNLGGYYYAGEETNPLAIESNQGFGAAFINISIPIFRWGEKKYKLAQNKLEEEQITLETSKVKKQISIELQRAIDKMDESILQVSLSEKSKRQAQENSRILNDNFTEGIVTSEEVLEAEALYQSAQLEVINARVAQQLSYSNYLKVLGKLSNNTP